MFELMEAQELVAGAARKLAANAPTPWDAPGEATSRRRAAVWRSLSEQGWPGVLAPQAFGGWGGSAVEVFLLSQAGGAAVMDCPFLSSSVICATILSLAADERQQAALWPPLSGGDLRLALAHFERENGWDWEAVGTVAEPRDGGYVLSGRKTFVLGGPQADHFIVSAACPAGAEGQAGLALFLVRADAEGLTRRPYRLIDGQGAADVELAGVHLGPEARLGGSSDAGQALQAALTMGLVALIGEAVGALEEALRLSRAHLGTRTQFGRPLAEFQTLRHRLADIYMALEEIRSIGLAAAFALAESDPDGELLARSGKVHVGVAGVWAAEQAVQLHGGLGMSDSYPVGHYLKRLTVIDRALGGVDHHIGVLAGRHLDADGQ